MVTPYQQARQVYEREPCAREFEADLYWHLRLGWVINTPTMFLMVRQVMRDWPVERLRLPWYVHPRGDALWVWLLAGDGRQALSAAPWPPFHWIGWERQNRPRWYPAQNCLAKLRECLPHCRCGSLTDHISSRASLGRTVA